MKNKNHFITGILLIIVSLILIFIGLKLNLIISIIAFVSLFLGIALLMRWSTVSYSWVCDECGENFDITLKQNISGINAGVNYKCLYCPKCHKKTMCKGIAKR